MKNDISTKCMMSEVLWAAPSTNGYSWRNTEGAINWIHIVTVAHITNLTCSLTIPVKEGWSLIFNGALRASLGLWISNVTQFRKCNPRVMKEPVNPQTVSNSLLESLWCSGQVQTDIHQMPGTVLTSAVHHNGC